VLAAIVVAALGIGGYLWWRRRQKAAAAAAAWHTELVTTRDEVKSTRDLLHDAAGMTIEPNRLQSLRYQADAAAGALGHLSATAPDDEKKSQTEAAEQALRGYAMAIDAEQLLRTQTPPASEDALADANVTRRARGETLDHAVAALEAIDQPPKENTVGNP
jgi:hypothetical protein